MKISMIAALAAAQLSAAAGPAQAAELPRKEAATQTTRVEADAEFSLAGSQASADRPATAAQEEPRKKKRKNTGDKVLTGAAVILGIGALAVGGLLVAIAVN